MDVFNTLMFSRSEYPAHMSTISEYCITCPCIKHQCTSEYLTPSTHALQHVSRTFRHIQTHTPSCISKSYSCTKHAYSEYSPLFTHTTQTTYRIFKDLWIFPISLPQHSRHIGTHLRRFLLHETMHRHILQHLSIPINPVSCPQPFEV